MNLMVAIRIDLLSVEAEILSQNKNTVVTKTRGWTGSAAEFTGRTKEKRITNILYQELIKGKEKYSHFE